MIFFPGCAVVRGSFDAEAALEDPVHRPAVPQSGDLT